MPTNHRRDLEVRPGDRPSAARHNALVNAALRNHTGRGTFADSSGVYKRPSALSRAAVAAFRVEAEQDDYLECKRIRPDGTVASNTVMVAKAWFLRRSALDGQTYTFADGREFSYVYSSARRRTVTRTSDGETNDEVMTPDYVRGVEEIVAVRAPTGLIDGSGNAIVWLDQNNAGRHWATISDAEAGE